MLIGGDGIDTFTGGSGADIYVIDNENTLRDIATNTSFQSVCGGGVDEITDFDSGSDTLQLLSSVFGNMSAGTLTNGVNFSVISDSYDGTNAGTNLNHGLGLASFVYSQADSTLHYDSNGSTAGYQAVAEMAQPGAGDIEIVAA